MSATPCSYSEQQQPGPELPAERREQWQQHLEIETFMTFSTLHASIAIVLSVIIRDWAVGTLA